MNPVQETSLLAHAPTELPASSSKSELSKKTLPVQSNLIESERNHAASALLSHDSGAAGVFHTETMAALEIRDAVEYLEVNSDARLKIAQVLRDLNAQHFPRSELNHASSAAHTVCRSQTNDTPITPYLSEIEHFWRQVVTTIQEKPQNKHHVDAPFWTIDLSRVVVQYAKFCKHLPGVQPFYAMKCNPSPSLLAMIAALGGCFDCASIKEIETIVHNSHVSHEDIASNIIFANPCKMPDHMRRAAQLGVRMVTFDNEDEIYKLARYMPKAEAVLRIATDDSAAVCKFSTKFGTPMGDVSSLLRVAKETGVNVIGVSFHVGSGNSDPKAYLDAINNARQVFDLAKEHGFDFKLLDIGGGWPGSEPLINPETHEPVELSFSAICQNIRPVLEKLFPDVRIIAEPGRFFAHSTQTLAMNVHSRRRVAVTESGSETTEFQYYVGDGLYHSFNAMLYDFQVPNLQVLRPDRESAVRQKTTIFGPTCDSLDCVLKCKPFPDLELGEWLFVPEFGAYTSAGGSDFNGYSTDRLEHIWSLPEMLFALTTPENRALEGATF